MMMMSLRMGSSSLNQQSNHGIMNDGVDSSSSSSSEVTSTVESLEESDLLDEANSSASSSSSVSTSSGQLPTGPLHDMSSLMQQLPLKRGLSTYFQGKSQSFTSLSSARCLEDLAKPENPKNKKLKSCKSHGGLSSDQQQSHRSSSRFISKKALSRGSCSSLGAKRTASFLGNNRPPIHPPPPPPHHHHGSTSSSSFSNQTPLFA